MPVTMERSTTHFLAIRKRNGQQVPFDANKIAAAILKAGQATGEFDEPIARKLTLRVLAMAHLSVAQVLFFESDTPCRVSYADRHGKYQNQSGITLPKM